MEIERHLLVVDDEMGIREGCKRALSEEGYIVDLAEDGTVGLQKVKEGSYDLLLVDLMMPGIDGLDLIRQVHEIDPEIIMIVITGYATIDTAVEATKRGAYDYLTKPFTPEALSAVVGHGLEKRALRLEALRFTEERERRLLELAREKSHMRTVISCMADGVLVVNKEGKLVLWNTAAVKTLQLKDAESPGKSLNHYIENETIKTLFEEVLNSDDKEFSMISREFQVDDQEAIFMANVAPVRDETGEVLGAVNIFRDITKLKEIDRIKSQFVSMVAHELKAPLAAIEGWLELVITGEVGSDAEQCQKYLIRAKERAHTLLALVNDLLEINRMEAGKIAMKMEPVALSDIVQNIANFFKPEAEKRKISIEIKMPENLPSIQADVRDMEKLFTNFINNAIKYNVENGSVIVEGSADQEFVAIRVTDSGVGISEENLSYIFEDFFRVEDEKSKTVPGTGLGLTIAKKIADSHLGHIEVESRLGKGSTFSVYFPRKRK